MVFNLVVYFNMVKSSNMAPSFNSAPSFRPPPPPTYQEEHNNHDSRMNHHISHDIPIKHKSEMNDVATSTPNRADPEPKRDNLSQRLYISIRNRDISGRCDLDWPVDFSQAEEICERDPRCKAFVEVEGQAYLKSCADPDTRIKEGRTLYVHHSYYSRETPNLRASSNLEHEIEKNKVEKPPPPLPPHRGTEPPPHHGTQCVSSENFNHIPQILHSFVITTKIMICITH